MIDMQEDKYYVDGNDSFIKQRMEDFYKSSISVNQAFWAEAEIDLRFKNGDQTVWDSIYGNMPEYRKKQFNFNRIQKILNMITGHQRKNRKSLVTLPVENSDQYTSDQLSKALFWSVKRDNVLHTFSDAFEGAVGVGMNMLSPWMDYRYDTINGDVRVDNVGYSSYIIDPYFRKTDLSDCNGLWRRSYRTKKTLEGMFPARSEDIDLIRTTGNKDGKFEYMPEAQNLSDSKLLALDEFWYSDDRPATIIEDVVTGDSVEFFGEKEELDSFMANNENAIVKKIRVPTVKVCYSVNGTVLYNGPNPYGTELFPIDKYPFIPVLGYYEPDLSYLPLRIQGVCRGLRDAQFLYNRRKVIELDILESQLNSGYIYEENALVDPNDVFLSGQGKGLAVKDGRLASIKEVTPPQIPPSMLQISESLGNEIMQISGVNEELLGSATDDKAGVLAMLRQGAGLVTLEKLFDNSDYAFKLLGERIVEMIQANFKSAKIERITGQEASPQFKDKAFQKYDIEVVQGMNTETQKQMQFAQMLELHNAGVPLAPEDILDASQMQNKAELIENMKKREEVQAQQAQQAQMMQIELLKAQINSANSKALADQGLGIERVSRVSENESLSESRHAQAIADLQDAQLSKAKAMKELSEMDLNEIEKLLMLSDRLKVDTLEDAQEAGFEETGLGDKVEALQTLQASSQQTMAQTMGQNPQM